MFMIFIKRPSLKVSGNEEKLGCDIQVLQVKFGKDNVPKYDISNKTFFYLSFIS